MEAFRKIDIHAHITAFPQWTPPNPASGYRMLSPEEMIGMYDRLDIERGVLLPLIAPEGLTTVMSNEGCILAAEKYPDRFSWFCNLDPRAMNNSTATNLSYLLEHYKKLGAKGVGEVTSNLWFDDPLMDNLFSHCEEVGLPLLFHISPAVGFSYGIADDLGLPRLEKMLKKHPKLQFIGHSQPFWSEMSADNTEAIRNGYPSGKVTPGRLIYLMREYENLTCDLSAGSGSNALTRDPENAVAFLTEFQDRIYYGCDICASFNTHQFVFREFIDGLAASGAISETVYRKVCRDNAAALLGL
ncbi:MAG: amidohydrolase family protein [Clostridia bacterium]|nr:amidohydrolase family protein [Clostridia bacterium]